MSGEMINEVSEEVIDEYDMTHAEVLVATQMLYLNNFSEPLCQQVNETLVCLYKCVQCPSHGDITIHGVSIDNEEMNTLIKKHLALTTCAMFYNHGQVAVEFFKEHTDAFKSFLQMVHSLLPLGLTEYGTRGHFSTYEVKLLVCGLSKAFFRQNWNDLPFKNDAEYQHEMTGMATRISNCLYWLKLQEDTRIYFQSKIMQKRAELIDQRMS